MAKGLSVLVLWFDSNARILPVSGFAVGFICIGLGIFALGVVIVVIAAVVIIVLVGRHVDVVEDDSEEVAADFFDHLLGADGHRLGITAILDDLENAIDSPPIMGVSDASILASEVDMVLQVIQYRRYPQPMTIRAKQMIEKVGGNLLGIVLNNINMASDENYYYYSG